MMASQLRAVVVSQRATWVREMLAALRALPASSFDEFLADARNVAAAESYVRRALEALLDLGRHILAKGFAIDAAEYKEIAAALTRVGALDPATGNMFRTLAGYRNRLVHFYDEVTQRELYEIASQHADDIETVLEGLLDWVRQHPDMIDRTV